MASICTAAISTTLSQLCDVKFPKGDLPSSTPPLSYLLLALIDNGFVTVTLCKGGCISYIISFMLHSDVYVN